MENEKIITGGLIFLSMTHLVYILFNIRKIYKAHKAREESLLNDVRNELKYDRKK